MVPKQNLMIATQLPQFQEAQQGLFGQSAVLSPFSPRLYLGDYGEWQESQFMCHGNLMADLAYTKTPRSRWVSRSSTRDHRLVSGPGTFVGEPCYEKSQEGVRQLRLTAYLSRPGAFLLQHSGLRYESLNMDARFLTHIHFLKQAGIWKDHFRLVSNRYVAERSLLAYTHKGGVSIELKGQTKELDQELAKVLLNPSRSCFFKLRLDGLATMAENVPAVDMVQCKMNQSELKRALDQGFPEEVDMGKLSVFPEFVIDNQK